MTFDVNKRINVFSKLSSSSRTKNRIRENGTSFVVKDFKENSPLFDGRSAILLLSEKTQWFGWLPVDELDIH
jgi:hypothetical protein